MSDLSHLHGNDLQVDATGDLLLAAGAALSQQRVLRRLLTNPLDDAWNTGYGAGLPRYVGQSTQRAAVAAVIRAQMRSEAAVARQPVPEVTVAAAPDGTVTASVGYADAATGATAMVTLPVRG